MPNIPDPRLYVQRLDLPPAELFWARVDKRPDGCWLWPVVEKTSGYGAYWLRTSIRVLAHRMAWMLTHGDIPSGLLICHTCDVRPCVNPAHLFIGTASDNTRDSVTKGSWVNRGAAKPRTGYNLMAAIKEYHRGGVSQAAIARKYGVPTATLCWNLKRSAHVC